MIIRLTSTLANKIKESDLPLLPADPNPFADWAARLFTADRAQYILITNSASLYSVVIYGRGVTDDNALLHGMTDMMREVMEKDGFRLIYEKQVAPQAARVSFSKALSRSVTGSMNDLVFQAKWHLIRDELSPYDVSFRLNETPMSYLKYRHPRDAFQSMGQNHPTQPPEKCLK
jgi:hypothetical protein